MDILFRSSGAGVALIDRGFRYLRVNEGLAVMNGLSVSAHLGRTIRERPCATGGAAA